LDAGEHEAQPSPGASLDIFALEELNGRGTKKTIEWHISNKWFSLFVIDCQTNNEKGKEKQKHLYS
jgi:hypothetical protein